SPLLNISRGEDIPNFLLVHQNSRRFKHNQFVNELQSKGHSGDLFNAAPFNHSQINQLLGDYSAAATMTTEVLDFFQDCRFNWRTSSGEEQTEEALDISPIPTKDWLNIRSRDLDNQQLSLFDLQGRLLTTQTFSGSNTRIDLSNLPEGVYLLTIQEANGKQVMQRKVLKGSVGYR
ncbi:MAG: T9SS type A sorting domain-containing protein, partial [Bacteroidota bacterium]